jgi:DNA-binding transcriptional ArsR family regulator
MRTSAPPLLPLFRSAQQARLLTELFVLQREARSLTELAEASGIPLQTVQREVERLERAGLIRSLRVGRTRLVEADRQSPYFGELRALLGKAFGPAAVLRELISPLAGVRAAFIFGSWARRYAGEEGPAPADIDLLVIGSPVPEAVYAACREAESRLGLPVNPSIVPEPAWKAAESGFLRTLREEPRVAVVETDE